MKILVATEKPFAPVAIDGIRKEVEAAGHQLVLLEKYTDKAQLLEAVKDVDALCAAITRTLDSPNEKQHYDLTNYNWDTIAAEVNKQYELLTPHP